MNGVSLLTLFLAFFPWGYVKLAILVLIAMYIIFAAVIVRQEQLMSHVVEIPASPLLRLIAVVHFFVAIGVFVLSLFLL